MEQYIEREERISTDVPEGTWPNDGHTPLTMYEAQFAPTRSGYSFTKWFLCPTCGQSFPVTEGVKVNGRYFSIKNGCAEEQRLRRKS